MAFSQKKPKHIKRNTRLKRWFNKYSLYILLISSILLLFTAVFTIVAVAFDGDKQRDEEKYVMVTENTGETEPESNAIICFANEEDIVILAKLVWGEARGVPSKTEQAAVIWCALNRVDSKEFPNTIAEVVTQKNQFFGYQPEFPVTDEFKALAEDVLCRYYKEKAGKTDCGRVLPDDYLYFCGDGKRNHFRKEYLNDSSYYNWNLESPYED